MLIVDVVRSDGGNEYTVYDSLGSTYQISGADLKRLDIPFTGMQEDYPVEMSDDIREKLVLFSEKLKCIKYIQWYIAGYGEKSIKRLMEKCRENGYSRECTENALELLCSLGVINERYACERRVSGYACEKLYGRYRILRELINKGYRRENIDSAFESCEIDFYENAVKLYKKLTKNTVPQDIREKKKLADKMLRYGYSFDQIKYATDCDFEQ